MKPASPLTLSIASLVVNASLVVWIIAEYLSGDRSAENTLAGYFTIIAFVILVSFLSVWLVRFIKKNNNMGVSP